MMQTIRLVIVSLILLTILSNLVLADESLGLSITPVTKSILARRSGLEARMLWLDATANLERLSTREGVTGVLDKCVDAGINAVAVGVKSSCGFALYKSKVAPRMEAFMGRFLYPRDYDLLQTVITEGHKRGIRVYAMVMVFSEGRLSDKTGPAYGRFPEWQSLLYDVKNGKPQLFKSSQSRDGVFVFVNPALPQVRRYELSILKEIAARYDVDGIVIDRCRFDGLRADFSSYSRQSFEKYLGRKVAHWPEDIYKLVPQDAGPQTSYSPEWGPYYKKWLEWRAGVISEFIRDAKQAVKKIKPRTAFGSVVGAWYPEYSPEGANWASKKFNPEGKYEWAGSDYYKTGYADNLDFLVPNCYGKKLYINDAGMGTDFWWTVQGGAQMANQVTLDACYIYAGLYVADYKGKPEEFKSALRIALQETNGVKIFDLSQIEEYGWWPLIKEAFKRPINGIPHEKKQ